MARAMIPAQRRRRLLEMAGERGIVSIRAAAEELDVSLMTVRRDVAALDQDGLLDSVAGGFGPRSPARPPIAHADRAGLRAAEKRAIAAAAAREVGSGDVVFLDAGTTCQALVPHLADIGDVLVVTNDLHTAAEVTRYEGIRGIHLGGDIDHITGSTSGWFAVRTLRDLEVDLCVLGASAWAVDRGVRADDATRVELKQTALAASRRALLVADASKHGARGTYAVCAIGDLDAVITDRSLTAAAARDVEQAGARVLLA